MEYLLWLLGFVWVPAALLWWIVRPGSRWLFVAGMVCLLSLVAFTIVEWFIVRYPIVLGEGQYLGVRLFTIPLEDYLFFATFPLFIVPIVVWMARIAKERA